MSRSAFMGLSCTAFSIVSMAMINHDMEGSSL